MTTKKEIGPWRVTSTNTVFDNPWITVIDHGVIHPDGAPGEYGVVRFKNIAVGILPVDEEGYAWLVGQHRFALDRYSWELPEGGGALGVDPLISAKRELKEETGLSAAHWAELSRLDISNSVTDEIGFCYLAWDLTPGDAAPDGSEALTIKRVSFNALLEMVIDGEITDSLTIVMTLSAHAKALRGALPDPISKRLLAGIDGK